MKARPTRLLAVTPELAARIRDVEEALAIHVPGRDSSANVELPKLRLADVVLQQVRKATPAKARLRPSTRRRRA